MRVASLSGGYVSERFSFDLRSGWSISPLCRVKHRGRRGPSGEERPHVRKPREPLKNTPSRM